MVLPACLAAITIALYASLLPAGRWQGDEYITAAGIMRHGFSLFWQRLTGWSPRPVGEVLTYLYLSLSNHVDRPLIGSWLALLWGLSFAFILLMARRARLAHALPLAAVLMALSLLIAPPGEMFYWPMAATAYLPCWAAMMAVTLMICGREEALPLAATLVLMAWSVEMGAVVALIFAGAEMLPLFRRGAAAMLPWLVVACCAFAVCLAVLLHRVAAGAEVMDTQTGLAGHWVRSALVSFPLFAQQVGAVSGLPLALGIALKLSLLLLSPNLAANRAAKLRRLLWALALLFGAWFSIVAALHEFGTDCCQRQNTLRQTMILFALISLGGLIIGLSSTLRALLMAGLLGILLALRGPALTHDMRLEPRVIAERIQNWRSGQSPHPAMRFVLTPAGQIVNSDALPPGSFRAGSTPPPPWYAAGIMERFGKQSLLITTRPSAAQLAAPR
jgi:hypothetical protein